MLSAISMSSRNVGSGTTIMTMMPMTPMGTASLLMLRFFTAPSRNR